MPDLEIIFQASETRAVIESRHRVAGPSTVIRKKQLAKAEQEIEARKQRNRELKANAAELKRWKVEKERANMEKLPFTWKRPTRGKLEAPVAKPAAVQGIAGDDQENGSDEDEEDGQ